MPNDKENKLEDLIKELPKQEGKDKLKLLYKITNLLLRKPSEAIPYANEGVLLAQELGEIEIESRFLNRLGITNHYLGKFDEATNYYRNSADIAKRIGLMLDYAQNLEFEKAADLRDKLTSLRKQFLMSS